MGHFFLNQNWNSRFIVPYSCFYFSMRRLQTHSGQVRDTVTRFGRKIRQAECLEISSQKNGFPDFAPFLSCSGFDYKIFEYSTIVVLNVSKMESIIHFCCFKYSTWFTSVVETENLDIRELITSIFCVDRRIFISSRHNHCT